MVVLPIRQQIPCREKYPLPEKPQPDEQSAVPTIQG